MKTSIQTLHSILDEWQQSTIDFFPNLLLAIIVIIVSVLLARLLRRFSSKYLTRTFKKETGLVRIISSVVYFFLLLAGIFMAFQILGLEKVLTKLLAGAGIIGIIAGFAFKDVASNLFAGMLLKLQRPFKVNDWVEIDSNYGHVLEVSWITTSIKTIAGQEVFVPNQLVYSNIFTNYSTFKRRRIILKSGVSYGDNLERVKTITLDEVMRIEALLPNEEIDFFFTDIGSSSYNFEVRFWIKFLNQVDYLNAMSETIVRIKNRFEKENICIAYPVTTLDFGVKGGVNIFDKALKTGEVKP